MTTNYPMNRNEILARCEYQASVMGDILMVFPVDNSYAIAVGAGATKEDAKANAWNNWRVWLPKIKEVLA